MPTTASSLIWHNETLQCTVKSNVSADNVQRLLAEHDCLSFPQLKSGLFPAINVPATNTDRTGYGDAWLRDTAWVAYGLWQAKQLEPAQKAVQSIINCLYKVRPFFEKAVQDGRVTERPPVRFTGQDAHPLLDWANAQNDALAYSLWIIGRMAQAGDIKLSQADKLLIELQLQYLHTIQYWQDLDSGQWEEIPKLNSSSLGAVIAGLEAILPLLADTSVCDELITKGRQALHRLLPDESKTPGQERTGDAGQLFMVEPLGVVDGDMAERLVANIEKRLVGPLGVRRYIGDSYWGPDYREHFLLGSRTADFSDPKTMAKRDKFLTPGAEAQWTLFDPLLSAYYARRFQATKASADRQSAHRYLLRALAHITTDQKGAWRIPEAYFMEHGVWVPNDHLGLLWSQANLLYALRVFKETFQDMPIGGA